MAASLLSFFLISGHKLEYTTTRRNQRQIHSLTHSLTHLNRFTDFAEELISVAKILVRLQGHVQTRVTKLSRGSVQAHAILAEPPSNATVVVVASSSAKAASTPTPIIPGSKSKMTVKQQ